MMPMHGPLRMNWNMGRTSQGGRSGHTSGLSWSKAKRLLATARTELQDTDDINQPVDILRFCNVFIKLCKRTSLILDIFANDLYQTKHISC